MPVGLQTFDENGNILIDTPSRPLKILQANAITAGVTVNISVPVTTTVLIPVVIESTLSRPPIITQSTGNLNIAWEPGTSGNARLLATEF
jgi:hypothetical protein